MKMHHINIENNPEISSEKSFGLVFSIVFLIISLYPIINSEELRIWALILSFVFLFVALFLSKLLVYPNKIWFKFGLILGSIIAPVVMAIVYFLTVLPTGVMMRLFGKDLLNQKFNDKETYWITRKDPIGPMKNQF